MWLICRLTICVALWLWYLIMCLFSVSNTRPEATARGCGGPAPWWGAFLRGWGLGSAAWAWRGPGASDQTYCNTGTHSVCRISHTACLLSGKYAGSQVHLVNLMYLGGSIWKSREWAERKGGGWWWGWGADRRRERETPQETEEGELIRGCHGNTGGWH